MRKVLSFSVPKGFKKKIDYLVKKEGYSSRSEFVRSLIRKRDEREGLMKK
ncbi:MAG: ribbon-helix-helix domain-containing protein [Patescibacteria group bacterium]